MWAGRDRTHDMTAEHPTSHFGLTRRQAAVGAVALLLLGAVIGVASCQSWTRPTTAVPRDVGVELPGEPDVRVRIRTGIGQTRLSGATRFEIGSPAGVVTEISGPADVKVDAATGRLSIVGANGVGTVLEPWAAADVAGEESGEGARITVDGTVYPGRLRLIPRPLRAADGTIAGSFDVVALIPVETYLPGVIAKELYQHWSLGAFEVQAVAARSYALHERQRSIGVGRDFDVESTTADQVYGGSTVLPVALQAVKNTRGVVLTWEHRLLRTYYSSTCGGRTASAADTWPTTAGFEYNLDPPLQSHSRPSMCTDSKLYRWTVARDIDELTRRVRAWGASSGNEIKRASTIINVSVDRTNGDNRPAAYRLRDSDGRSYLLSAEELRIACNFSASGLPAITSQTRVASGDIAFVFNGSQVSISGRGFGHGVGMCQHCAQAMAARGDDWRTMLVRFYPGAKLERAY